MKIANDTVADIHYTLKNGGGKVLDSSSGGDPMAYLHGKGNLIPGLEKELEGKSAGEKFHLVVSPESGYGDRDETLVQTVPLSNFDSPGDVKVGVQFQMQLDDGPHIATVTKIDNGQVTVDLNHPLAGETLHFDVEIVGVRASTAEERSHGHVHGAGGHHHH